MGEEEGREKVVLAVKEGVFQHLGTSVGGVMVGQVWYGTVRYGSAVDVSKESEKRISEQRCLLTCLPRL